MLVVVSILVLVGVAFAQPRSGARNALLAYSAGLVLFCGVGILTTEVHPAYPGAFVSFVAGSALMGLLFVAARPQSGAQPLSQGDSHWIDALHQPRWLWAIVIAYLACRLSVLLLPSIRVGLLLNPGPLDLTTAFQARFEEGTAPGGIFMRYGATLLFPFFLIALAGLRKNLLVVATLLLLPAYFQYASDSYISRGELALPVLLIVGLFWLDHPRLRLPLVLAGAGALPMLTLLLAKFAAVRLGQDASSIDFATAFSSVLGYETSLPGYSWAVFDEQVRANLGSYSTWLITLPFPKLLSGTITDFRLNAEIAELVLGISPGERGFFIFLTGIVTESVYLFDLSLNWVHGAFVTTAILLFCRALPDTRSAHLLHLYAAYIAGYVITRGGISAGLPPMLNGMFLFYLVALSFWLLRARPRQLHAPTTPPAPI